MTSISYTVEDQKGVIYWASAEHFKELENKLFFLGKMEAVEIEKLQDITPTAKILLSAVAGAVIQHLIDKGIEIESIFANGTFVIGE